MPFEAPGKPEPRRVAVVGAGVSGLGAAYALSKRLDVTVFEAEPRLGGHARTVETADGVSIDTGFIVFNKRNYPLLTRLFSELDVPAKPSDMSFGARFDDIDLEYALSALFAQRRNMLRPRFWRMIRDLLTFNRKAETALQRPELSLQDFLAELRLGEDFRQLYLLPFAGAIWSASHEEIDRFPASTLVRFFKNHGLLSATGQPEWLTVDGGSRVYVEKLAAAIEAQGGRFRVGAPVEAVTAGATPAVRVRGGAPEAFDAVVLACHADQAARIASGLDDAQRSVLGAFRYSTNRAVLHSDARVMPERRACWSSWNYRTPDVAGGADVGVSYWMNRLQSLPTETDYFVTLNPAIEIDEARIVDQVDFQHPVFDHAAIAAQARLAEIQGRGGLWFCGAYGRYGFHEDGLMSGFEAAKGLGAAVAWA